MDVNPFPSSISCRSTKEELKSPPFASYYTLHNSFSFVKQDGKIYVEITSEEGNQTIAEICEIYKKKIITDFLQKPFAIQVSNPNITFYTKRIPADFLRVSKGATP